MRGLVRTTGFSLLEVMLATVIFILAILPSFGLLRTSSTAGVLSRDRMLALSVGRALVEDFRTRRAADRTDMPATDVIDLPQFEPIRESLRSRSPEAADRSDAFLDRFRVEARIVPSGAGDAVEVTVRWTMKGEPKELTLTSRVDGA